MNKPALTEPKTIFLDPKLILRRVGLKTGQRVADLGCGGGYFVLEAAREVGDKGIAYGVDILQSALSAVASRARMYGLSNVETIWSDAEVLGGAKEIKDNSIDAVLMIQLLSQSHKHEVIFDEATRLVRRDGSILVVDWRPNHTYRFGPQANVCVPVEKVRQLASPAGWKCTSTFEAGPYHYGLIFKQSR